MTGHRALLLAAALAAALPAAAPAAEEGGRAAPVRLGYFIGGRTSLFGRAFADGAFEREGVRVKLVTQWLRGDLHEVPQDPAELEKLESRRLYGKMRGGRIIDLIAAGKLDGGLVGEGSFVEAVHAGKPVVAVALLGHDAKDSPGHGIVLRRGLVIRSPADFRGLTLISRRAGPTDALILRDFLRVEGVPEKDVKLVDQVDEDRFVPMLKEGKADGGYLHLMDTDILLKNSGGSSFYVYRPMNWLNPELSHALLVFGRDFLRDRRDLAVKIVAAYARRILYERSIPHEKKEKTYDRGVTNMMRLDFHEKMTLPVYDHPPALRPDLLKEVEGLLLRHGRVKAPADFGRFTDYSVVKEAVRPAGRR